MQNKRLHHEPTIPHEPHLCCLLASRQLLASSYPVQVDNINNACLAQLLTKLFAKLLATPLAVSLAERLYALRKQVR